MGGILDAIEPRIGQAVFSEKPEVDVDGIFDKFQSAMRDIITAMREKTDEVLQNPNCEMLRQFALFYLRAKKMQCAQAENEANSKDIRPFVEMLEKWTQEYVQASNNLVKAVAAENILGYVVYQGSDYLKKFPQQLKEMMFIIAMIHCNKCLSKQ